MIRQQLGRPGESPFALLIVGPEVISHWMNADHAAQQKLAGQVFNRNSSHRWDQVPECFQAASLGKCPGPTTVKSTQKRKTAQAFQKILDSFFQEIPKEGEAGRLGSSLREKRPTVVVISEQQTAKRRVPSRNFGFRRPKLNQFARFKKLS